MKINSIVIVRNQRAQATSVAAAVEKALNKIKIKSKTFTLDELAQPARVSAVKKYAPDLIICLGGDGTMLSAIRLLIRLRIPFCGINAGRLGFLTDSFYTTIEAYMKALRQSPPRREKRIAIQATIVREGKKIKSHLAINDIIFRNYNTFKMTELELKVQGESINQERGDGIIICTPTGSTAYSMSSGGPIISPDTNCICITPIAPHYLSHRPLVLTAGATIAVSVGQRSRGAVQLSNDGREYSHLQAGDMVTVKKYPIAFTLIYHPDHSYFQSLRKKLQWGATIISRAK